MRRDVGGKEINLFKTKCVITHSQILCLNGWYRLNSVQFLYRILKQIAQIKFVPTQNNLSTTELTVGLA